MSSFGQQYLGVAMRLTKIISGGQTGVDRAALDAALAATFPCGGWTPGKRVAEAPGMNSPI